MPALPVEAYRIDGVFGSMAKPLTKAGCGPGPETASGLRVHVTPPSVLFETPQLGGPLDTPWQMPAAYMVVGVSGSRTSSSPPNGPNTGKGAKGVCAVP